MVYYNQDKGKEIKTMKKNNEIKCNRCAELCGCWRGQNGGKPNCLCFSPKITEKPVDKTK